MIIKNTINRADFENGVEFIHYYDCLKGSLYYTKEGGIKRCLNDIFVCGVDKITDDGFRFSAFLFNVGVSGFAKFEHRIKTQTEINL